MDATDATITATPVIFFDRGETAFDLLCETGCTAELAFSFRALLAAIDRGARTAVLDESIAKYCKGLGILFGTTRVVLVVRRESATKWQTADAVGAAEVITCGELTDVEELAEAVRPFLGV